MKVSFFDFLNSHQGENKFKNSDEMAFFLNNRSLLSSYESLADFMKAQDSFDIIRANILIRSLMNKKTLERIYFVKKKENSELDYLPLGEYMEMGRSELPYFNFQNEKIFIAFFPLAINRLYANDISKISEAPYKNMILNFSPLMVDAFDYYGNSLFNSHFTKLVNIANKGKIACFLDYDADALYFINDEGRLDAKISFFDKYLISPKRTHFVQRALEVAKAYFYGNKQGLIDALFNNGFISLEFLAAYKKKVGEK